jgi:hypothetical protein
VGERSNDFSHTLASSKWHKNYSISFCYGGAKKKKEKVFYFSRQ